MSSILNPPKPSPRAVQLHRCSASPLLGPGAMISTTKQQRSASPPAAANHVTNGELRGGKRPRKRGRGAESRRPRGGRDKQEQRAGRSDKRTQRLRERAFREAEAVCSDEFLIQRDALASSLGWQGCAPPKKTLAQLKALCQNGGICELLGLFYPVPYLTPPE